MLDNATSSLKVEPLDGNNWFTFRPAMTARFQQRGLWRVVTGDVLLPPIPVYFVATGNPVVPLTAQEVLANSTLENDFDRKNDSWFNKDEKARGNLQAHVSVTQRVHIEGESTTYAMWQALIKLHVQQVPGMCFNTYNDMFSIAKAPGEDLTSVAACAEQALAHVQELCPATITDSTGASIAYGIQHLDDELALMAMLCALLRDEYGDFVLSLMRTKDLSCKDIEAAFQVEQTKRNASCSPLYTPAGHTALRTQDTRRSNRPAPSGTPPCIVGKHHAEPFPAKASHCATRMLERVHSDLHMVPTMTASGYRYWMTFIDDWSRYEWIYLLKHKSDAFEAFKTFKAMVEKQYDLPILCFHEDKGGEYIGHVWDEFFAEHGIRREHTVTGLSQQNGVAERQNCTLEEHVIAMLNNARLPIRFWGKALSYYARC
jgi:transposase InsO family protein